MAYENGKTYYIIPLCATGDAAYNQKILKKQVQPLALNIRGTGEHYNNRNVNVYSLDWSTDMQWKIMVYDGFARILCAGDTSYGLDYYYGSSNPGNCDIYKVSGNEEDSKINFRTINASENLYRIQCYRNNADNDLYLTATGASNGADVRWQPLDSSKATQQTWWLVPIENVSENATPTPTVPITPSEIKDQEFFVKAYGTNYYLNVHGTDTVAPGRNVNVYEKENCNAQKWIARQETAGPKLFTKIDPSYALNIDTSDNNCTMYTASGNDTDSVLAFEEMADMLYRIKMHNHNKYLHVDTGATSSSNVYWVADINSATYWEFIPEDIVFPESGQTPENAVYLRKHNTEYFLSLDANNNVIFANANDATEWALSGESNNCVIKPANNLSLILQNNNGSPIVSSSQNTDVYGVIDSNDELTIHSSSSSNTRSLTGSMLAVVNGVMEFKTDNKEIFDIMSETTLSTTNTLPSSIDDSLNIDEYYFIRCNDRYLTYDNDEFFISDYINVESEIYKQLWKIVLDETGYKIVGKNILANALGISSRYNTCESSHISDPSNTIYISRSIPEGKYSIINTTRKKYLTPDIHNPFWSGMSDNSWEICPPILNKYSVPATVTGEITITNIPDKLQSKTNYIEESCPAHKASGLYEGIDFKESKEGYYITEAVKNHATKVFKDTDLSNMTDKDYTYYIFGERLGLTSGEYHPGVDVNPGEGENIYPLYGGTVTFAGGNYGTVSIYVPELKVHMNYVHMTDIPSNFLNYATEEIKVTTNTFIGKVGKKGLESRPSGDTGPHLHFEIVSETYTNSAGKTGPSTPIYNATEPLDTILPYWYMYNA